MDVKTRTTPSPQTLHRNRRLLVAGVLTVLPAAAIVPSLINPQHTPAMLSVVVVDQMLTAPAMQAASANERAVNLSAASGASAAAKPQAFDWTRFDAGERSSIFDSPAYASMDDDHSMNAMSAAASVPASESSPREVDDLPRFNGRPVRPARTMSMLVTAYSPDERSCGDSADGITASGYSVWTNAMKLVAADTDLLPFGTLVSVPGYDDARVVPVLDRGGAIKGNRLDVLFPTHEQAERWGVQELTVTVWEYADGLPGDYVMAWR